MSFVDEQIALIKDDSIVIVYPEALDKNIIKTAVIVAEKHIAAPVLLGPRDKIEKTAQENGLDITGIRSIDPSASDQLDAYAEEFAAISGYPVSTGKILMKRPLYFGAMMARMGDADCMCAGIETETAEVVAAYKLILGMAEGIDTPSGFTIVEAPYFNGPQGHLVAFADGAINIDPTSEELADIAIASAQTVRDLLGWVPRVALLSFSTLASSSHENARKVARAAEIAKERRPDLYIDGEMQLDTALSPEVAKRKFNRPSEVAGQANVLIVPNLDAGNIGVKLLQRMGGANTNGGLMQGFTKPVCDLSRGSDYAHALRNSVVLIRIAQSRKESL